jgi:hypothetical protein
MSDFGLKLTRFPARSPLPIAALPSVSPIPSARLLMRLKFSAGLLLAEVKFRRLHNVDGHRPPRQKNAMAAIVVLYVIHV